MARKRPAAGPRIDLVWDVRCVACGCIVGWTETRLGMRASGERPPIYCWDCTRALDRANPVPGTRETRAQFWPDSEQVRRRRTGKPHRKRTRTGDAL